MDICYHSVPQPILMVVQGPSLSVEALLILQMLLLLLVVSLERCAKRWEKSWKNTDISCAAKEISKLILFMVFFLHAQQNQMKESKLRVYVRRGGPNWEQGLAKMRALSDEINVPIEVYADCPSDSLYKLWSSFLVILLLVFCCF